jgi:hypothetical protein
MSRQIKFRAWDKHLKTWTAVNGFEFRRDGTLDYFDHRIVFQQYTGLLDNNGKEIYEGDVLADSNGFTYKVFWYDATASFELAEMQEFPDEYPVLTFHFRNMYQLEVIGNEFEQSASFKQNL